VSQDGERQEKPLPRFPTGKGVWKPFPRVRIPEKFVYRKITEYFGDVPEVSFNYTTGVTAGPLQLHAPSETESDGESDEESGDERGLLGGPEITFQCLVRNAVMRSIDKGQQFLSSKRVLAVFDCARGGHTFVKGQVQASMESVLYPVIVTLSQQTGRVCDAVCSCKARALQRCGHIASVLLTVWEHVRAKGYEGKAYQRIIVPYQN